MFFWTDERKLTLLKDVSDKLEFEAKDHPLVLKFEACGFRIFGLQAEDESAECHRHRLDERLTRRAAERFEQIQKI